MTQQEQEQELIKFIEFVGTVVPEFAELSPEEIVTELDALNETPEGQEMLAQLGEEYQRVQSDPTMFALGGKIEYLASKFARGGRVKRCSCGCAKITKREHGGLIEKCACGCKSHQKGGNVDKIRQQTKDWKDRANARKDKRQFKRNDRKRLDMSKRQYNDNYGDTRYDAQNSRSNFAQQPVVAIVPQRVSQHTPIDNTEAHNNRLLLQEQNRIDNLTFNAAFGDARKAGKEIFT